MSAQCFPELAYQAARAAYADGDLAGAALHLGHALAADPERPEWLDLLDRVIDASPDPLAITPFTDEGCYIAAVLRAYALERVGRLEEALEFLLGAAEARPDVPFIVWAPRWLARTGAAPSLDLEAVSTFLAARLARHGDSIDTTAHDELSDALPLVRALLDAGRREPFFVFTVSTLYRRLGRPHDALALAGCAYEETPCATTALALAFAHEALGNERLAAECFARALMLA